MAGWQAHHGHGREDGEQGDEEVDLGALGQARTGCAVQQRQGDLKSGRTTAQKQLGVGARNAGAQGGPRAPPHTRITMHLCKEHSITPRALRARNAAKARS